MHVTITLFRPTATVLSHFPPIFTVNHPYADIGQTIPVAPPIKKRVVGGATLAQNRRSDVATVERYSCLRSKLGVESPDSNHQEIETSITGRHFYCAIVFQLSIRSTEHSVA